MDNYIIPCIIGFILIYGLYKNVDVFAEFLEGAKDGLHTVVGILPALIALMTCVGMFKASGGLDVITHALSPLTNAVGIPKEIVPLALCRPISGSGALCIYKDIISSHGADSFIGRCASVLMGSTETTFYTVAVYYGAAKIYKTRYTIPCALAADLTSFLLCAVVIKLMF